MFYMLNVIPCTFMMHKNHNSILSRTVLVLPLYLSYFRSSKFFPQNYLLHGLFITLVGFDSILMWVQKLLTRN